MRYIIYNFHLRKSFLGDLIPLPNGGGGGGGGDGAVNLKIPLSHFFPRVMVEH